MKTLLRKTAVAAAFFLTIAASSFTAKAESSRPVYEKSLNRAIGISVESATGANYTIRDEKGNIVKQGVVKNNKTFFISTAKLPKGTYRFVIGNLTLQEFVIK